MKVVECATCGVRSTDRFYLQRKLAKLQAQVDSAQDAQDELMARARDWERAYMLLRDDYKALKGQARGA